MTPFTDDAVESVFQSYPQAVRKSLLAVRELIFATAGETPGAGTIVECLKWGQPSYLTTAPKSGSTIRIDAVKNDPSKYGMYVHCRTSLVSTFRDIYEDRLTFQGNRALLMSCDDPIPENELRHCIALALTYHLMKADIAGK